MKNEQYPKDIIIVMHANKMFYPLLSNIRNVKQSMDELEVVSFSSKIIPNVCALSISPYNMDKEYMYAVGDEYGFVTAFYRSYSARGAFTFLNGTESRRICCPVPNHTLSSIQSLAFSDEVSFNYWPKSFYFFFHLG